MLYIAFVMEDGGKVYIVYGIPFSYADDATKSKLEWLLDLMVPDQVQKYSKGEWWMLGAKTHTNGYRLFDFPNDHLLVLGFWWRSQGGSDEHQLLDMPTEYTKGKFTSWCVNNNIDSESIGFYMITSGYDLEL